MATKRVQIITKIDDKQIIVSFTTSLTSEDSKAGIFQPTELTVNLDNHDKLVKAAVKTIVVRAQQGYRSSGNIPGTDEVNISEFGEGKRGGFKSEQTYQDELLSRVEKGTVTEKDQVLLDAILERNRKNEK